MPDQNPFQQMSQGSPDPHSRGEPRTSKRSIAQQAAAEAVRGDEQTTASPGTRFSDSPTKAGGDNDYPLESETSQFTEFEEQDDFEQPDEYDDEVDELDFDDAEHDDEVRVDDTDEIPGAKITHEEYEELQDMGVDIPVSPDEVPEEFQDTYAALAQSILDAHQLAQSNIRDAQDAIMQVQDFKQRLSTEEGQRRMLVGMALTNPDVFQNAQETIQRMQEDPDFRESIIRQMEAEARLEAAERKERAIEQTQAQTKGQQIENRAVRLANRYGVNEDLMKEMVVAKILQNEETTGRRDITIQEVDQIAKSLARRTGATRRKRSKSPKTREKEQRANRQPAQGAGRDAPPRQDQGDRGVAQPSRQQSQGGTTHFGDTIRQAVKQAGERVRSKGL